MKLVSYLIVKNEEKVIEECLSKLRKFCDDIIVLDTGSNDRTEEIARKYGKVYKYSKCTEGWIDDFAYAKNEALRYAEELNPDWVMYMDADEVIEEDVGKKIRERLEKLPAEVDGVILPLWYAQDNLKRPIVQKRERIFRKGKAKWVYPAHEVIDIRGLRMEYWGDCPVVHKRQHYKAGKHFKIFEKVMNEERYKNDSRMWFYWGNDLRDAGMFREAIEKYKKFLELGKWDEERFQAKYSIARCYYELGERKEARKWAIECFQEREDMAENTFLLGIIAFSEGRYKEAIRWFKASIIELPDTSLCVWRPYYDSEPIRMLVHCYFAIGDMEKAKEYCIKYLRYDIDNENYLYNLKVINSRIKSKFRLGWMVYDGYVNWVMGSHRIRRLRVSEELDRQGEIESVVLNGDYYKGLECNGVVFCSFGKEELEWIKRYKKAGIKVYFDANEFLAPRERFPYMGECMEEADVVVCCSQKLKELNKKYITGRPEYFVIPDGWE